MWIGFDEFFDEDFHVRVVDTKNDPCMIALVENHYRGLLLSFSENTSLQVQRPDSMTLRVLGLYEKFVMEGITTGDLGVAPG